MKWPSARITHIGLHVSDIDKIADFYVRALGMKVMRSAEGRFATLSFGYQHHDIALIPASQARAAPGSVGVHHVCFDFGDYDEWVEAYGRLVEAGVQVNYIWDHRTGMGIYFQDPDGNKLEIWCESFPTMAEAIQEGRDMVEEFEENFNGYYLDRDRLYQDCLAARRKRAAAGELVPQV